MRKQPELRLGVDVGGTHTDAVLVDRDDRLLAKIKVPTTADVTSGIEAAISGVLGASTAAANVSHVMIGTTHATNAVLERKGLARVAVLRIGGPATHAIPPLFGWPEALRRAVSVAETIVDGGSEFDGRELVSFDRDAAARFLASLPDDVDGVAVSSVFSPVSPAHELLAEEVIRAERGNDIHLSLSHEIGTLGLLERENATVLNEALVSTAKEVVAAIRRALDVCGLGQATAYFTQNDGTLMSLDYVTHFPVLTIGSGPANSIRGAAHLSGVEDAVVVDVGGTSTDVGMLVNGFPRESAFGVRIGGIATNFRMPDLVSIALGGGTVCRFTAGDVVVGPDSVGYRLEHEALAFGGATPTLSDAAIAADRARFGTQAVAPTPELARALAVADEMLAEAIDRVKTAKGDVPLIAVGGGSVLVPDAVPGVAKVLRPSDFDVANAVGAAIGTVSGQVDRIFQQAGRSRQELIDEASAQACAEAVRAGADPEGVEVVELEDIPLSYLTNPSLRLRVKAAGPLAGL
ncbi:MAG TPA: hydantoinase/oxoprolinase family protein [Acidimicrobiales bacterium]|nr:hydantoinase/oxoprolinase family protein [Acidimicrobiales bacterium]